MYHLPFRGQKAGKSCIDLNSQPVGLARVGKNIVVACMDETLQAYTTKVSMRKRQFIIRGVQIYTGAQTIGPEHSNYWHDLCVKSQLKYCHQVALPY